MFWNKNKPAKSKTPAAPAKPERSAESQKLRENALKIARNAIDEIGEDTLKQMARALEEQNRSAGRRARDEIRDMDKAVVADHLRYIVKDD